MDVKDEELKMVVEKISKVVWLMFMVVVSMDMLELMSLRVRE
jgi:hypothetical protein